MWLSKFSSLSRRSNRLAFGALHESIAQAALIRLHRLDAAAYGYSLRIMALHVLVDLLAGISDRNRLSAAAPVLCTTARSARSRRSRQGRRPGSAGDTGSRRLRSGPGSSADPAICMSYGVTRIPDRHDPRVVAANERVRAACAANGVDVGAWSVRVSRSA